MLGWLWRKCIFPCEACANDSLVCSTGYTNGLKCDRLCVRQMVSRISDHATHIELHVPAIGPLAAQTPPAPARASPPAYCLAAGPDPSHGGCCTCCRPCIPVSTVTPLCVYHNLSGEADAVDQVAKLQTADSLMLRCGQVLSAQSDNYLKCWYCEGCPPLPLSSSSMGDLSQDVRDGCSRLVAGRQGCVEGKTGRV